VALACLRVGDLWLSWLLLVTLVCSDCGLDLCSIVALVELDYVGSKVKT
jgi:hypothetical protein